MSGELSENYLNVSLPANFVGRCVGLGSDAVLLLIGFFELLSQQESPRK